MAKKYNNIVYFKTLQNLPKLGFLVWKYAIWQPCIWRCVGFFLSNSVYRNASTNDPSTDDPSTDDSSTFNISTIHRTTIHRPTIHRPIYWPNFITSTPNTSTVLERRPLNFFWSRLIYIWPLFVLVMILVLTLGDERTELLPLVRLG
jgi:hypothetical protein